MSKINKIKQLRLERAWSQEQLAEISTLSVRTIQRVENGSEPSLETSKALAAAFDIKASDLFKEKEPLSCKRADEQYPKSLSKIEKRAKFYASFFLFSLLSLLLALINIIIDSTHYWFIYPVFCFLICLIVKWLRIFIFSAKIENWKKKKLQQFLKE